MIIQTFIITAPGSKEIKDYQMIVCSLTGADDDSHSVNPYHDSRTRRSQRLLISTGTWMKGQCLFRVRIALE